VGRWKRHHLTGRDHTGGYLDPELTVPVCHDHHTLFHDDWHTGGVHAPSHELSLIERVEWRLRRAAAGLARIPAQDDRPSLLGMLATALAAWAAELGRFRRHLDQAMPEWRTDRGFYPLRQP
jgi:hypothetical protein